MSKKLDEKVGNTRKSFCKTCQKKTWQTFCSASPFWSYPQTEYFWQCNDCQTKTQKVQG